MTLPRLSIRSKFLFVLGILLLMAVVFYTLLASSLFKQEKIALLYEINQSVVTNASSQLKASFVQLAEQMKPYVLTRVNPMGGMLSAEPLKQSHVKSLAVFRKTDFGLVQIQMESDFEPLIVPPEAHLPFLREAMSKQYFFWKDRTVDFDKFLFATRMDIRKNSADETLLIVVEIESEFFFHTFQMANIFQSYLLDRQGVPILFAEANELKKAPDVSQHPLIEKVREKTVSVGGTQTFSFAGETWYGAYSPVGLADLYLLSQAEQKHVEGALALILKESLKLALGVLFATFLISIFFSQSLTHNLSLLAERANAIGKGDLSTRVNLRTGDEVEALAEAINTMAAELKTSRDEIEEYNRELEKKVDERTKELKLKNIAIKDAQEALLKTTQLAAAGEVAGRVAHEILNPLTGILTRAEKSQLMSSQQEANAYHKQIMSILSAWTDDIKKGGIPHLMRVLETPSKVKPGFTLLQEDLENLQKIVEFWQKDQDKLSGEFKFIYERGKRINHIVNEMRKLVRSSVEKNEIHCNDAAKNAIDTMSDYVEKEGVSIKCDLKALQDRVVLNGEEFNQIITNLIRNSVQAIRSGGKGNGQITIRSLNEKGSVCLDIIDNGPGIEKDKQPLLFGQGFTTKSPEEGTGLGLAICRRYARAFGGDVTLLHSNPGKETCFRITIPLLNEELKAA